MSVAKVVVKNLQTKAPKKKRSSVVEKTYTDSQGRKQTIRKIDAKSKTFGSGLEFVFKKNVTTARSENKRLLGRADYAPRKG